MPKIAVRMNKDKGKRDYLKFLNLSSAKVMIRYRSRMIMGGKTEQSISPLHV